MRRVDAKPRANWQARVEAAGLTWYSGEQLYWNESAFYDFTSKEVETLEAASNDLAAMTLRAAAHIIENKLYDQMGIPDNAADVIERSWEAETPSLYGRFDLAFDGLNPPKLLEYNADTPTSLLEAAVIQWYWLQDVSPSGDQFNSIHERLILRWKELRNYLPNQHLNFCSIDDTEDGATVAYLKDNAHQAGLSTSIFPIDEIGWSGSHFVDADENPLGVVFKLYPWEWMVQEEFAKHLGTDGTIWIEPPWKMLVSNKGMLPVLWDLYPNHPNLLKASFEGPGDLGAWVKKPMLGREGANITLHQPGLDLSTEGSYGAEGFIFQELVPLSRLNGKHSVIGSWVIGHEENSSCGIGVRESESPIITNTSQFVPHRVS